MKKPTRKTSNTKRPAKAAKAKAKRQPKIVFETQAARKARDFNSTPELDQGRVALENAEERRERELASSANIDQAKLAARAKSRAKKGT